MKIKKEHLSVSVVNYIRNLISSGEIHCGDPLPSARKLSIELGVSRTVTKQAMDELIAEGIVEYRGGVYVLKGGVAEDSLSATLHQCIEDPQLLIKLSETRNLLEMYCVERAALLADQEAIDRMQAAIDGMIYRVACGSIGFEYEATFHNEIVNASGNPIVQQIYAMFSETLFGASKLTNYVASQNNIRITGPIEHQVILDAIKARNVEDAKKYMHMHLDFAHRRICGEYGEWPFGKDLENELNRRIREIQLRENIHAPIIGVPDWSC